MFTLDQLLIGEGAEVKKVMAGFRAKQRLAALGIIPRTRIEVLQQSPGYIVRVKGSTLVLGRGLVSRINVHIRLSDIKGGVEYVVEGINSELSAKTGLKKGDRFDYKLKEEYADEEIYLTPVRK